MNAETTLLLRNFQSFLRAAHRHLQAAGVHHGSDEWDELVEQAFRTLVLNPIEGVGSRPLGPDYACWSAAPTGTAQIVAKIAAGTQVLVGHEEPARTFTYQEKVASEPLKVAFREFGNPLMKVEDIDSLNFVHGEVFRDCMTTFSVGTRIAIPVDLCEFDVEVVSAG